MIDTIQYKVYYRVVRIAMKLRLYVIDYHTEFDPHLDSMVCVIQGRWRWEKRTEDV